MKRILLMATVLLSAFSVQARSLVVTTTNGQKAYFNISDTERPVMQFIKGTVWVNGRHYQFGNVKDFRIVDEDPTGISAVEAFTRQEGAIVVGTNERVVVATIDGKIVEADITVDGGKQVVRVDNLPKGIYVIRAGKNSFKFVKR